MNAKMISQGIVRAVLILTGIYLFILLLLQIQSVILYFLIAAVVSLIGRPIVGFLKKRLKFNNTSAALFTLSSLMLIFLGLIALFVPMLIEQGKNLSLLNVENLEETLHLLYQDVSDFIVSKGFNLESSMWSGDWLSSIDFSVIPDLLNSIGRLLSDFAIGLFSVVFISFFLLKDSKILENSILILIPKDKTKRLKGSLEAIKNLLSRYFIGLMLQICILFIVYTLLLLLIGVENAVIIAFLCALLNLIPFVGPFIAGILMIVLTMTNFIGADLNSIIFSKVIFVSIGFAIGQIIDNFFSQPFIFSNSVKSHPLEIFIIIIISGLLAGPLGMIVAIPCYTSLKVILKEFLSENRIVQALTKNL